MIYADLQKTARKFWPAIWYDEFLSSKTRNAIRMVLYILTFLCVGLAFQIFTKGTGWLFGPLFLICFLLSIGIPVELFYNALYFRREKDGQTFQTAEIIAATDVRDVTLGFLVSGFGQEMLYRFGIYDEIKSFYQNRKSPLTAPEFAFEGEVISLTEYAHTLFKLDHEFKDFLFKQGILEADFVGTAEWLEREILILKERQQWWTKRSLSRVQSLGRTWSYGQTWLIERYARQIHQVADLSAIDPMSSYHKEEIEELEVILSRNAEANALLLSEDEASGMDVIARLGKLISLGMVYPGIAGKRVFVLDINVIISAAGEKATFEQELLKFFNQAVSAGNLILIIPNLPSFIGSAHALGSDVLSLIDPYITGHEIQIIALADTMSFHTTLEADGLIASRFEKVFVKGNSNEETLRLLEDKVKVFERREGVYFTYPALLSIAESADRYIVNGTMPDKAVDLMVEIIPSVKNAGQKVVLKTDVLKLVQSKTGIPVTGVKTGEADRLQKLEQILHERIVGQNLAVNAISDALRRARAGISNPNRPMGSFLFLGPTGVGKTETTKALAEVFFGTDKKILRLDMSEYNATDSLNRLIGSFEGGKSGTLVTMLRENPYGVLLLDEFEKANYEVHNLFLQILDEGIFSDMLGKKVNARNLIIIATSNAGSDIIWEMSKQGKDLREAKDQIIDSIIKAGIYKPELLNRFDGVILFTPLGEPELRKVSEHLLLALKKRLEERRINLVVNDVLIDFLVKAGADPKFGARPLNRAIQDKIESVIAKKIIADSLPPGAEVSLSPEDLKI